MTEPSSIPHIPYPGDAFVQPQDNRPAPSPQMIRTVNHAHDLYTKLRTKLCQSQVPLGETDNIDLIAATLAAGILSKPG